MGRPDRRAWGGKGGSTERKSRPWESAHPPAPLFHQHPPLSSWPQTFLTSELTWLLALAKAGCIYCVVLTFCDFMLDTRVFFFKWFLEPFFVGMLKSEAVSELVVLHL